MGRPENGPLASAAASPSHPVIDFRLYRIAWLPAVAAFVAMMFSLEGIPAPFEPAVASTEFDADRAAINARQLLAVAPERAPGSDDANAAANLVAGRFREIEAGTTAEQDFEAEVAGLQADLRNVVLTLPGESDQIILVVASREEADGPGAPSSAAATATLLELADLIGGSDHAKTFVFVSTAAGLEGSAGVRAFIESFGEPELIEAAVVISQPGFKDPRPPFVLRHSTDDRSTSIGLVRTAEATVAEQVTVPDEPGIGFFAGLARLAFPVAVGEQAVLISEGIDAIGISSAGETPLPPADSGTEDLDPETLTQFGSATLDLLLALDQSLQPLEHGPEAYVEFSENLIPGWAIAVLALALILPAGVAALDGVARSARRRFGTLRAIAWAFGLALPLLGAMIVLYLLSVAGIVADPVYPFDPGRFTVGFGEVALMVLLGLATVVGYAATGLGHTPQRLRREALVPALGAAAVAGAVASWLLNPFLALWLVPAAHVWLVAARGLRPSRLLITLAAVVALLPLFLALRSATGSVDAGVWDVVLMVTDGHIPSTALIALTPVFGAVVGTLVLGWGRGREAGRLGARPQAQGATAQGEVAEASIDESSPRADQ